MPIRKLRKNRKLPIEYNRSIDLGTSESISTTGNCVNSGFHICCPWNNDFLSSLPLQLLDLISSQMPFLRLAHGPKWKWPVWPVEVGMDGRGLRSFVPNACSFMLFGQKMPKSQKTSRSTNCMTSKASVWELFCKELSSHWRVHSDLNAAPTPVVHKLANAF